MSGFRLLERHAGEWRAATSHPFLDGIREGSLPGDTFAVWLQQDYLFVNDLLSFHARLLATALRRAQEVLAGGLVTLESELTWFEAQMVRRGLILDGPPHPTTQAYREELDRLLSEPFEVAMTALWALEQAYLEAWRGTAPGATQYREFVEQWTVPNFATYVTGLEVHSSDSPGAEVAWVRILRLEHDFWDMALGRR